MATLKTNGGIKQEPYSNDAVRRGPITSIMNGRGVRPWLPQLVLEPGYVYVVTKRMTLNTPMGTPQRACRWCVLDLLEACDGHADVDWEERRPASDELCPRCGKTFVEEE